jgi:hypothetical protein
MKKLFSVVLLASLSLAIATGCRTSVPVYNVEQESVVSSTEKALKADDVKKAIMTAGSALGWVMKADKPGHIIGTLNVRKHMAKIAIQYNAKSYSISYLDSLNLNYDGDNIHGNYNGWIQRLQSTIQTQLNMF